MSKNLLQYYFGDGKTAGFADQVGKLITGGRSMAGRGLQAAGDILKRPGVAQTAGGVAAGEGLTQLEEHVNPNMTGTGAYISRGVNWLMGGLMGNPAVRASKMFSSLQRGPAGRYYGPDISKYVKANSLWAAKTMGITTWDKINQTLTGAADSARGVKQTVDDAREQFLGVKPGETPEDAAARRVVDRWFRPKRPAGVPDPNAPPPFQSELDKAWSWFKGKYGETPEALAEFQKLKPHMAEAVQKEISDRDMAGQVGNIGETITSLTDPVNGTIPKVQRGLEQAGRQFSDPTNGVGPKIDAMTQSVKPIGDLAGWVQRNGKNIGIGAGATLAGVGGFKLLQDWLNYRRVEKERQARQQLLNGAPKLAGLASAFARHILPAAAVGGVEGYMNHELDPDHPGTALMGAAVGAAGGSQLFRKVPGSWGRLNTAFNPKAIYAIGGGAILPRALAGATAATKGMLQDQNMKPWLMGGAALGGVGLLALIHKAINKPAPEVAPPVTNTTVFAGGTGGPDNPNVGGKLKVTLPTRNPGDNETVVEVPLENIDLPHSMFSNIRRDAKRRLRRESAERIIHRDPVAPKLASLMEVFHAR